MELTADRLRQVLSYDPDTGVFTWRKAIGRKVVVGTVAGSLTTRYIEIGIDNTNYRAHRLAWLYMTGAWPRGEVDHSDEDKKNNRWKNLRDATRSVNLLNQRDPVASKASCRYRGVFPSTGGRWFARIKLHGVIRHLGTHDTQEQAHMAYVIAKTAVIERSTCGETV